MQYSVPLLALTGCRYPIGDELPYMFRDAAKHGASSYFSHHHSICFRQAGSKEASAATTAIEVVRKALPAPPKPKPKPKIRKSRFTQSATSPFSKDTNRDRIFTLILDAAHTLDDLEVKTGLLRLQLIETICAMPHEARFKGRYQVHRDKQAKTVWIAVGPKVGSKPTNDN